MCTCVFTRVFEISKVCVVMVKWTSQKSHKVQKTRCFFGHALNRRQTTLCSDPLRRPLSVKAESLLKCGNVNVSKMFSNVDVTFSVSNVLLNVPIVKLSGKYLKHESGSP